MVQECKSLYFPRDNWFCDAKACISRGWCKDLNASVHTSAEHHQACFVSSFSYGAEAGVRPIAFDPSIWLSSMILLWVSGNVVPRPAQFGIIILVLLFYLKFT